MWKLSVVYHTQLKYLECLKIFDQEASNNIYLNAIRESFLEIRNVRCWQFLLHRITQVYQVDKQIYDRHLSQVKYL